MTGARWAIASGVYSALLDSHLLIGVGASAEISLLNPAAAQVWLRLRSSDDAPAIARYFVETFGVSLERAHADVEALLQVLRQAGVIFNAAETREPVPMPLKSPPEPVVQRGEDCYVARCAEIYRLGNRRFGVEYRSSTRLDQDGQNFIDRVVALLSGIAEPAATRSADRAASGFASLTFCIGPAINSISGPGIEWHGPARIDAYTELCLYLLNAAYGPVGWVYRLHAASVAIDGKALVLPAPAGSGKSTLSAYLTAHGWEYLGDDTANLEPHLGVLPFPAAIGLKVGSLPVLQAWYAGLNELREYQYGDKSARYVAVAPTSRAVQPKPLSAIVIPQYAADSKSSMERLSAPEAAARVMAAGTHLRGGLTQEKLDWLAGMFLRTPCFTMSYASLPDAAGMLREVVGR